MMKLWKCSQGVTVSFDTGNEYVWRIGDSDPGLDGPVVLMADGEELSMIRRAIRAHSWRVSEPKNEALKTLDQLEELRKARSHLDRVISELEGK